VIVLCVEGIGGTGGDRMPVEIHVGGWTESTNQSTDQLDQLIDLVRYTRRWGSGCTGLSSLHYSSPADQIFSCSCRCSLQKGPKKAPVLISVAADPRLVC